MFCVVFVICALCHIFMGRSSCTVQVLFVFGLFVFFGNTIRVSSPTSYSMEMEMANFVCLGVVTNVVC